LCQKKLGKIWFFEEMLALFNYIERGVSWKNIPPSPIRNKNKTLHRTVNASSCLDLSAFTIGGRSRRNVLRTGGCRGARVAARTFPFTLSLLCALCASLWCVLQLPSAIVRFLERLLPQAVVRYAFLDSNFFFCFSPLLLMLKLSWSDRNTQHSFLGKKKLALAQTMCFLLEQLIGPEPSLCVRASSSSLSVNLNFSLVFHPTYGASFCVELFFRFCQFFLSMRN
jgi:hypothetical protein